MKKLINFIISYRFLFPFILVSTGIIIIINHFIYDPAANPAAVVVELGNMQEKTIETLGSMNELLMTLSTAIFGLIGFFIKENNIPLSSISKKMKLIVVASLSFAILSLDFGFIYMEKWVELLANEMFLPYDDIVNTPRTLQFTCFLLSLGFLGIFVTQQLNDEN